jgi:hypothetical protein
MSASRLSLPIASPEGGWLRSTLFIRCFPGAYRSCRRAMLNVVDARLLALIMMEADAAGAVEAVCGGAA